VLRCETCVMIVVTCIYQSINQNTFLRHARCRQRIRGE